MRVVADGVGVWEDEGLYSVFYVSILFFLERGL